MKNFETHPLDPGEGIPLFISGGVIKEPAQLEPFTREDIDPLATPAITIGGFTFDAWEGNAKSGQTDFVYYEDRRMAGNARGLPNPGREGILALKEPLKRLNDLGLRTIIQVTNLPQEAPIDVIPDLVELAASVEPTAIEVNLSCPNGLDEDGNLHPPLSSNPDASGDVMFWSRERVGKEVILGIKDSPHVTSLNENVNEEEVRELARFVENYIDFVTGINTIGGQPFPEIECAGGKGGMSGPVVSPVARQHLNAWKSYDENIPYLSTGGVDTNNVSYEVQNRLALGAMLVGGAQEFYRVKSPLELAHRWAQEL